MNPKEWRKRHGFRSQTEAAEWAGLSLPQWQRYEVGAPLPPRMVRLMIYADLFGLIEWDSVQSD